MLAQLRVPNYLGTFIISNGVMCESEQYRYDVAKGLGRILGKVVRRRYRGPRTGEYERDVAKKFMNREIDWPAYMATPYGQRPRRNGQSMCLKARATRFDAYLYDN